jgi:cyclohexyl-isocyanide hydratase
MIPSDTHLEIGSLLFEGLDQIDLTGPFEVLSRIPNSTYRIYGKTTEPVRDLKGLRLTPDAALADAPQLDVLHVPGGFGQEALMEDEAVLGWIREQAAGARSVFSVCTGALLCDAAGLLHGRRATTHWASFHLLPFFGAISVNERVVVDGNWVFAGGVTAGIDGAPPCRRTPRGCSGSDDPVAHGLRARTALQQRHARDRTRGDPGGRQASGAAHNHSAGGDGTAHRHPARHPRRGYCGRIIPNHTSSTRRPL